MAFHVVIIVVVVGIDGGFEGVNLVASHVEHFDGGAAFHIIEVDVHLSVVGIGNNTYIGGETVKLVNVQERGLEVELAFITIAAIFRCGVEYDMLVLAFGHKNRTFTVIFAGGPPRGYGVELNGP